ncbi:DUF3419 family protein [Planctomyces sp. SH-PL14]|uniref:DUF3419 family protein n=1 Tax=Planctomyces sp. SH-PL14 TaxID=1632864 RepID=UPI00078DAF65|nr:DUF3419 family protein [Planctomyces sp. SH-PL14]AMV20582.1 hypothetical protein VT03_21970 [Planctomyces sp. SH-PL14]
MPRDVPSSMASGTQAAPDGWAIQAARLPLAFAQVREDPRLDVEVLARLPRGSTVVMIASGGETAVELARLPLGELHLVDTNPAQLALTRLKFHLAQSNPSEAQAILGHTPMDLDERLVRIEESLRAFDLPVETFGPPKLVAATGPDYAGRYEKTFAHLRLTVSPVAMELHQLLNSTDTAAASRMAAPGTTLGAALDAAFDEVMSLPNLVALFGTEATQNPRQPFARHFAERTRVALARFPAAGNPFLWQIFAGDFPPGQPYDWFLPGWPDERLVTPVWHRGRMRDVLEDRPAGSADFVHLSNILDWLRPAEAEATLCSVRRALRPGGMVLLRQLNSTLDPTSLECGIAWDREWGQAMELRDRSFFYPSIHVGRAV